MNATTVPVDLAKSVFQLAVADEHVHIVETQRLTRTQFEHWFLNREVNLVVMEACAWANKLARICYATLRDKEPFGESAGLNKKINRESFVMPA